MSSSPEDSILPSPDQIHLKTSKDPSSFQIYLLTINRSISRNEEMDEDFILKITDSGIIYKHFYNRKGSLEYLIHKINQQNQDIINYKNISKSQNLKNLKEINNNFNNFFSKYLDKKHRDSVRSEKQLAFMFFRKKNKNFDMDRWKEKKSVFPLSEGKHTEDEVFEQLLEIYYEDDCCYSEIYIFSTNSLCFLRYNHVPCMIRAFEIATLLYQKHGIKIIIRYLKPWGFSGSYEDHLPECPIKDCIYDFENQMLGSKDIIKKSPHIRTKKKQNKKETDEKLLSPIYKQIIPKIEKKIFSMKDTNSTELKKPKLDFAQFSSKICKTDKEKFIKELNAIVSDLFPNKSLDKTFEEFQEYGLERFEECKKNINELLIEINHANICEEICEYLKKVFFPWWAKKVEDASSKFLKHETSCFFQKTALCLFHRDIKEIDYFDIGYVILENVNI